MHQLRKQSFGSREFSLGAPLACNRSATPAPMSVGCRLEAPRCELPNADARDSSALVPAMRRHPAGLWHGAMYSLIWHASYLQWFEALAWGCRFMVFPPDRAPAKARGMVQGTAVGMEKAAAVGRARGGPALGAPTLSLTP
jgi:hypothetical protein